MLREARMEGSVVGDDVHAQVRRAQMHDLIELTTGWLADIQKIDSVTLHSLIFCFKARAEAVLIEEVSKRD